MTVSDSVEVAAPAREIWEQIADPAQMPRWSPENTGAPVGTGHPLDAGETFHGTNKRGAARWTTRCTVTESVPGEKFAFDVVAIGVKNPWMRGKIANWSYTFEPTATGTRVTETWTDHRQGWPDWAAAAFDKVATGTKFHLFQERNIRKTLANLKADLEG